MKASIKVLLLATASLCVGVGSRPASTEDATALRHTFQTYLHDGDVGASTTYTSGVRGAAVSNSRQLDDEEYDDEEEDGDAPWMMALPKGHPHVESYDDRKLQEPPILCPFIDVYRPDTSSLSAFVSDCVANGVDRGFAFTLAFIATKAQSGFLAALRGTAPDVFRLDEAPPVSHLDLYSAYPTEVRNQIASATDGGGSVSLNSLVEIKKWVAERTLGAGEGPGIVSRSETSLLFLKAGGDLSTGMVSADNVLRLLDGDPPVPEPEESINSFVLLRASLQSDW